MNLKTVEEEYEDCLQAFKDVEVGSLVMHCHHESFVETLSGTAANRIEYIWRFKDKSERALRFRLFRPFPKTAFAQYPELEKAYAVWKKACAEWNKYGEELDGARAAVDKAYAEWVKVCERYHAELCQPGCPWNGFTIFGDDF